MYFLCAVQYFSMSFLKCFNHLSDSSHLHYKDTLDAYPKKQQFWLIYMLF